MPEITGLKTKFYREGSITGKFEEIAQVASITPPQPERDTIDVDDLNPPGEVRKKLVGLIDPGEVSLTLNFDPTNTGHTDLEEDFLDGEARQYRIKLPNDYGWTFTAYCTAYQPQEVSADDVLQAEVTLLLTGVYEFGEITSDPDPPATPGTGDPPADPDTSP